MKISATYFALLIGLIGGLNERAWGQAIPINTDVAIQPAEGQIIYRNQLRYRSFDLDDLDADVTTWMQSNVLVYGWSSRFSTALGVPLIRRDFEAEGRATDELDTGIGDITLLLRYQLWKKLGHLESQTWTVLGGLQIPAYDDPISSRSWDPIVGTIYSWHKNRHGVDADITYHLNTENDRDFKAGDVLRYDLAYQYRLLPARYEDVSTDKPWSLTGLLELNGEYQQKSESDGRRLDETDGHQLFLSPGLALTRKRTQFEAALQFPVYQNAGDRAAEDNVRAVLGFTITF
ncbi:MAG: transporter [Candidatus Hydrogenedentes bacterium]|nr:transporter [Candidatus Hydrogenedentota bacterium]